MEEELQVRKKNGIQSKTRKEHRAIKILFYNLKVSNNCIIGAKCELNTTESLPNNTVIFGNSNQRHIANEKPQVTIFLI